MRRTKSYRKTRDISVVTRATEHYLSFGEKTINLRIPRAVHPEIPPMKNGKRGQKVLESLVM